MITARLNPGGSSKARLRLREWVNNTMEREGEYEAWFRGQDRLLLRSLRPEKERGRVILMIENRLLIKLPLSRRPLQLPREQR